MKIYIYIIVFTLFCSHVYGQRHEKRSEILYELTGDRIIDNFADNNRVLSDLRMTIDELRGDSLSNIERIIVECYTSPEGSKLFNEKLSQRRSDAVVRYLQLHFALPDSIIEVRSIGIAWDKLRDMVQKSNMTHRLDVINIIDSTPEETWQLVNPNDKYRTLVDSRNKRLMDFKGGEPYRYMSEYFFPQLRGSSIITIYSKRDTLPLIIEAQSVLPIEKSDELPEQNLNQQIIQQEEYENAPLFAVKTNLLYDIVLIPNIEIEVPIGNRWSLAGEWIFPWWVTKNNGNALQIQAGTIEGRYWLGEREKLPLLTGWFGGVYAGGGYYDLQYKNNGYQGEFFIAAGLSAGYAHTINKRGNLRMEYNIGLGYLKTEYRYYEGKEDNKFLVWQYDGNYSWIGPTKLEVSLVLMLNHNRKKRGGVR